MLLYGVECTCGWHTRGLSAMSSELCTECGSEKNVTAHIRYITSQTLLLRTRLNLWEREPMSSPQEENIKWISARMWQKSWTWTGVICNWQTLGKSRILISGIVAGYLIKGSRYCVWWCFVDFACSFTNVKIHTFNKRHYMRYYRQRWQTHFSDRKEGKGMVLLRTCWHHRLNGHEFENGR